MRHCLDFELTECSGVCNASSTSAVATCQQTVQAICNLVTRPAGSIVNRRGLEESEGEEAQPVEATIHRELFDPSCADSPSLLAAINSSQRLAVVGEML